MKPWSEVEAELLEWLDEDEAMTAVQILKGAGWLVSGNLSPSCCDEPSRSLLASPESSA